MKAKDWARVAVSEPGWWRPGPDFLIDFDLLRGHVADAIRAAVEEERETCARVAETTAGGHYMAKIAAAAIRAMKDER